MGPMKAGTRTIRAGAAEGASEDCLTITACCLGGLGFKIKGKASLPREEYVRVCNVRNRNSGGGQTRDSGTRGPDGLR